MKLKSFFIAVGVALAALFPAVALAAAPDIHATPVDLRPLLQEILLTVASIASLVALWGLRMVGTFIKTKTGVNVLAQEEILRKYMESALQSGLKYASTQVDSADWAKVDTKNEMLNIAATYVVDAVPDALKYFNLDRAAVIERLKARFPDLEITLAAAAAPAAVAAPAGRARK